MNRIINFHDVQDSKWFESVLFILKRRYNLIPMLDLESMYYDGKKLNNSCHITIDDGHNSFYDNIYPVLKKHKVPATIFVSPQICKNQENFWFQEIKDYDDNNFKKIIAEYLNIHFDTIKEYPVTSILKVFDLDAIWKVIYLYKKQFMLGSSKSMNMNVNLIKEIDSEGLVEIGAHTMTHPILANEDDISSERQIKDSITGLSDILDKDIKYFAYPNGTPKIDFGNREINTLKKMNIKIAVSTDIRTFSKRNNPLSLPRFSLGHGSNIFVKTKLTMGRSWEILKRIKGVNEVKDRAKLKRIIPEVNIISNH